MKAVVGLGNPGPKYSRSRHNVGFAVLNELARRHGEGAPKVKFEAEVIEAAVGDETVLLAAPQTYMNRSGRTVGALVDYYRLSLENLLVVCDDINLPTGRLRFRRSGSAGGQKGLQDIINRLGTQDFARLRIGVGSPPERMDAADYVLSRFRDEEREAIGRAIEMAADGVEAWIRQGIEAAMNRYNAAQPEGQPGQTTNGK